MPAKAAGAAPAPEPVTPPPEQAGATPTPPAEQAASSGVSQSYVDEKVNGLQQQLTHLQNAVSELAASKAAGESHAGPTTPESGGAEGAGAQAGPQKPQLPAGPRTLTPPEPEHAPRPGHWYWRPIGGKR